MTVGGQEIERLALLARLGLSEEEKERFAIQISSIIDYVDKIHELDVGQASPLINTLPITNVLRDDEARPGPERDVMLKNGPDVEDGYFRVPKIM